MSKSGDKLIRQSGPYEAVSRADGTILIRPAWPQFPPYTEEDGGGPGLFSRMSLAEEIQRVLNQVRK